MGKHGYGYNLLINTYVLVLNYLQKTKLDINEYLLNLQSDRDKGKLGSLQRDNENVRRRF